MAGTQGLPITLFGKSDGNFNFPLDSYQHLSGETRIRHLSLKHSTKNPSSPPCSSTAVNSASSAPSPAPGVTATAARRALALGFRALGAACPLSSSSSPIPSALGAWAPEPGCAAACGESASLLSLVTAAAVRRGGDAKSKFRGGEARSVSSGPGLVSARGRPPGGSGSWGPPSTPGRRPAPPRYSRPRSPCRLGGAR